MHTWRDINKDSWTFSKKVVVGAGGGAGEYRVSYAVNIASGPLLNGKVSANILLKDRHSTGAGIICRADEQLNFLALYVAPTESSASNTVVRIGAMTKGHLLPIAAARERVVLAEGFAYFSLEFYSGLVRGELRTKDRTYQINATVPHLPFPGYCGVVKMYGAEVAITDFTVEKTEMQFSEPRREGSFDFDIFLCHSGADSDLVRIIAQKLQDAGVKYWLDVEQITFGDSITQKIEDGLNRSRVVVPCLSENLGKSGWTRAEYGAILNAEFSGISSRVVVPLKLSEALPDSAIPLLLRDKKRVLYQNHVEFEQFLAFLRGR